MSRIEQLESFERNDPKGFAEANRNNPYRRSCEWITQEQWEREKRDHTANPISVIIPRKNTASEVKLSRWQLTSRNGRFGVCWWDGWKGAICFEVVAFGRKLVSIG